MSDETKPETKKPKKPEEFELTASVIGGDGYSPQRPMVVRPIDRPSPSGEPGKDRSS